MDVDEMQTKLASWSQDPDFRFDDIYNLVYDQDWLRRAYSKVEDNSGSRTAGVDGQTMEDFEEDLEGNLRELRKSLKSQSFDPKPVRRTYIPKGDNEERPLGIPTIKDRIVQEALRMVLEPIYESDFSDRSFGFRPNRCTMDAIKSVDSNMAPEFVYKPWIIDADIKGFFDNVDHRTLEQIIQDRITDQKMRDLIWDFLKAGIMEDDTFRHSELGTPQGGIVSPVLANVYLNELDQWIKDWTDRSRRIQPTWSYVRYADDFLILTDGSKETAEKMLKRVGNFVREELNLELSDKKTELVHATDGIEFLGYHLEARETTGGAIRTVPKEAIRDIKDKVRAATNGGTEVSVRSKYRALNSILSGWANYYKYATNSHRVFNDLDSFVWHKLSHWLAEKFDCERSEIVNKVEDPDTLKLNGIGRTLMEDLAGGRYGEVHQGNNPYLDGEGLEREELFESDPWLANAEEYEEWKDSRWKTLEKDDWTCQKCGREIKDFSAHVHHKKPRRAYSDTTRADREDNLISLCEKCHSELESNR
ncbi:group II intron reverse transcriptase/maturase [Salinibacter ruber]|uniref:group II intron reverse transcriptase/maturase n=1 Tax=Salinibacter ruber TaxID=146919 RepID=UPI0021699189|nr:group II intron reverse transcriptase/maturase [Salinibacter ruber]